MTKVVHCKKELYDVYIGRPSIWGNPYSHLKDTIAEFTVETREEAIAKYRQHLLMQIKDDVMFRELLLNDLDGKVLGCWCKPQSCHGDVIIEVINMIKLGLV